MVAFGAVAAGLTAMIALATQVDKFVPDYATAAELEAVRIILAGGQNTNTAGIIVIQQRANKGDLLRNQAKIESAKKRGPVPQNLIELQIFYENERDRLRMEMKRLTK